jgi:chemotaxis protein MotB
MTRTGLCLFLATLAAACGVPEKKYQAAVTEASRNMKSAEDASQRAAAAEQKVADLTETLGQEKAAKAVAAAEAARQRALAGQLAESKEQLEAEKAVAAAEAARQRELAAQLAQEKTALEQKSKEYAALAASLDREIKAGQIQLSELQGRLTVRLAEKVLFASGSATIGKAGREALSKIAEAFHGVQGRIIRVEGHTDNLAIRTARFPSNWDLSAARAIAVVRLLQDEGVDPSLLGAAGYGEFQPVASNDTPEGRAENRRIEISLAAPLAASETRPASR